MYSALGSLHPSSSVDIILQLNKHLFAEAGQGMATKQAVELEAIEVHRVGSNNPLEENLF